MGQVASAWSFTNEMSLNWLFNGSAPSMSRLTSIMGNGQMIEGGNKGLPPVGEMTTKKDSPLLATLQQDITKAFFAYAIPQLWGLSGTNAFVLDTGYACGVHDPESQWLSADTMHKTWGCYNNRLYYLVAPYGDPVNCDNTCIELSCQNHCSNSLFSIPHGLDSLDGSRFGGVTISDLITGSLKSYIANGNANGAPRANPRNDNSLDDLMSQDITTPGFITIPVCSADVAYGAWSDPDIDKGVPYWPCAIKK